MSNPLSFTGAGTALPNVATVDLVDEHEKRESVETRGGVYVWPNGYVTLYPDHNVNRGQIVPPWRVAELRFGATA